MTESVQLFFDGAAPLLRILVVGSLSYVFLVFMLRVSGARTLVRMSPFDFAIIVAIGSTYGRLMTAEDVTLLEAVTAFALLVGLQMIMSILTARLPGFERLVSPQPAMVFYRGELQYRTMRRERVTEEELRTAVREHGLGSMEAVEAIIIETNGVLTVVGKENAGNGSALRGLDTEA